MAVENHGKSEQSSMYDESGYVPKLTSCVLLAVWKQKYKSWYIRARGRCGSCPRQGGQNPWQLRSELSELGCGGNPRSEVSGRGQSSRSRRRGCQNFRDSWWEQSDFCLHRGTGFGVYGRSPSEDFRKLAVANPGKSDQS